MSLCGALKNVVAIAAGFTDGLGWGDNAKAAVMRIGLMEMKRFSEEFFDGVKPETFTETSAGVADLITTCLGGRNRKCAEAFVKTGKPFDQLEKELLNGQKLQGTETAREVHELLAARGKVDDYPLFKAVYSIALKASTPTTSPAAYSLPPLSSVSDPRSALSRSTVHTHMLSSRYSGTVIVNASQSVSGQFHLASHSGMQNDECTDDEGVAHDG